MELTITCLVCGQDVDLQLLIGSAEGRALRVSVL